MKRILIYVWMLSACTHAVRRLTTIDINTDTEEVPFGKYDKNLCNENHTNITIKPDLKISKIVDKETVIWQNSHGSERCTYCHVSNYKKKAVLVMLFIQQFNDFYTVLRYRLFHGTWVPVTKQIYNDISKSIADFKGAEYDLEVDINQRFNPQMLTIHVTTVDHYSSYKLTPVVGYHIDRVIFAKTLLWERTTYQDEAIEIVLLVDDGKFEYMSILYETYYDTADTLYFKYNRKWEKISREEFFQKPDPPRTLRPYKFPADGGKKAAEPAQPTPSTSQQEDAADQEITGKFKGLTEKEEPKQRDKEKPSTSKGTGRSLGTIPEEQPSTSRAAPGPETGAVPKVLGPKPDPKGGSFQFVRPWEPSYKSKSAPAEPSGEQPSTSGSGFRRVGGHKGGEGIGASAKSRRPFRGLAPATFCYPSQVARDIPKSLHKSGEEPGAGQEQGAQATSLSFWQTRSRGSVYRPYAVYMCDHSQLSGQQPEPYFPKSIMQYPRPERVTSIYPELSSANPSLTNLPDHYVKYLEKNFNQLEQDLHNFEEYINDFDEKEFTNKRHKKRKGDGDLFVEQEVNTEDVNGVTLNLHELDDSHPYYTVERQSYYGVPVFKITPTGDIFFNCVKAGDKIAWTNHNSGTCHVVKAVVMSGGFRALELIVKRASNYSYLHYKYEKGYYASVHTPTYMNFVTSYAVEVSEENKLRDEDESSVESNRAEREKITKKILKEQEAISRAAYKQGRGRSKKEDVVEPFSLTSRRKERVRKRKTQPEELGRPKGRPDQ